MMFVPFGLTLPSRLLTLGTSLQAGANCLQRYLLFAKDHHKSHLPDCLFTLQLTTPFCQLVLFSVSVVTN